MTNFEMVQEFHKKFNTARNQPFTRELLDCRESLIYEESSEVLAELDPYAEVDKTKLAKELADLLYVTYGTADTFGIDLDKVFIEVHRSNMSKLGEDGKPIYREDGKVLKGPNYSPANLENIV